MDVSKNAKVTQKREYKRSYLLYTTKKNESNKKLFTFKNSIIVLNTQSNEVNRWKNISFYGILEKRKKR